MPTPASWKGSDVLRVLPYLLEAGEPVRAGTIAGVLTIRLLKPRPRRPVSRRRRADRSRWVGAHVGTVNLDYWRCPDHPLRQYNMTYNSFGKVHTDPFVGL
jgi:hypothetical protein